MKLNKLRGRMGELNLSIEQLSRIVGMSDNWIRDVIDGKRSPKLALFVKLCAGLKIGADDMPMYIMNMHPEVPHSYNVEGEESDA